MMQVNGGFRSPEDLSKTILNPARSALHPGPNDHVDRSRRIHLDDLENPPFFP
jgi:glutathione S-transferase